MSHPSNSHATARPKKLGRLLSTFVVAALVGLASNADAFTHIVLPGETLASIAERFYGKVQHERLLVVANSLEAQGGTAIVPGMRLEIPAMSHVRIGAGKTWKELARDLLGSEKRAFAIANANDSQPWLPPEEGSEVIIPYNLRFVATGNETVVGLAYQFLGDRKQAWMLDNYNQRKGRRLVRGDVVLIPLSDIDLTEAGKQAASQAMLLQKSEAAGSGRFAQQKVQNQIGMLLSDVRYGRYVDAIKRASDFLALGQLKRSQQAQINRQLVDAYVALGAKGRAAEACGNWLRLDPAAKLDAVLMSPKVIAACESAEKDSK